MSSQSIPSSVAADAPEAKPQARSLWRTPHYAMWFTADTADVFADALQTFALPLIAFEISRSEFVAGALATVSMVVMMVLMPVGGVIVDRHDRRRLMIGQGLGQCAVAAVLAVCVATGTLTVPVLVVAVLVLGMISGLLGASTDAILRSLIPTERFAKAQAVREGRESAVALTSSPVSGALFGVAAWLPMAVSAVVSLVGGACSALLPKRGEAAGDIAEPADAADSAVPAAVTAASRRSFLANFAADFAAGWRWTLTRATLPWIILFGALLNIGFAGLETAAQLKLIADGESGFRIGLIFTGMGVCSLVGAFLAGKVADRLPVGPTVVASTAFNLCCFAPLVFDASYVTIFVCLSAIGLVMPTLNAGLFGFMYGRTPEDMQGRVSSVFETLVGLLGGFAPMAAGWTLQYVPGGFTVMASATVVFGVLGLLIAVLSPIRRIPASKDWERFEV
ncbi:MFS transporter [Bifidobacterium avesanii]|uniref:MFS transporter n=1 Tax=Bifidobacterium avesanii TaxID=1798157 RepID=A0A7K3THA1_9BIFI|nr:MFS transporter [Bifidobacterium avesanii]KAB8294552.1 permease [Bifidobacterium avesanii]NEG78064.1 MFS transporter [Bifidobacterium avesanii]